MIAVDDLSPGMIVAVSQYCGDGILDPYSGTRVTPEGSFSGKPWRVELVSLPFAILRDSWHGTVTLDTRMWGLTRISVDYWETYRRLAVRGGPSETRARPCMAHDMDDLATPLPRTEADSRVCPQCREWFLVERLKEHGGPQTSAVWKRRCNGCGYEET